MPCRIGHIDECAIKEEIPDFKQRVFYVCGPSKMVESMICLLKDKLGIAQNNIIRENFAGY